MKTVPSGLNPVPILYLRLVRKQKVHIGAYLLLLLLTAGLQLPIPFFISKLIDGLSRGINSTALSMNIVGIVGLSIFSLLLSILGKIYSATLNQRFLLDIRLTVFEALQQAPLWFSRKFDMSDLQTRFTGDVGVLNYFLPTGLADAIRHVCFVLAFGGVLVYMSPAIVLYIVGFLPFAAMIFRIASRRLSTLADEARVGYAEANATIQESLTSLREGRITGSRQFHLSRLRGSLERSEAKLFRTRRYSALMIGALGVIPVMVTAMIWMVGGAKVDTHEMSVGQLVSFLLILSMLYGPISGLFDAASGYVYELAAFRRVASLLYVPSNPAQDHASTLAEITIPPILRGEHAPVAFELRDVVFSYRTTPVIEGLNAAILAGRCTALVGVNGAGKSTLVSLIAGLDYPSSGTVYLNNFPLRSLSAESLARHYGYVPQDVFIFGDSLRMNITMGRDIPDHHIHSTLAELGWEAFISEWSHGLDAMIPENGRSLSGGQRQKIAVLRALVNRPSVLILDEPENNLDKGSLENLVRYLDKLKGRCTVVLVTHGNAFQNIIDATLDLSPPHRHDVLSGVALP